MRKLLRRGGNVARSPRARASASRRCDVSSKSRRTHRRATRAQSPRDARDVARRASSRGVPTRDHARSRSQLERRRDTKVDLVSCRRGPMPRCVPRVVVTPSTQRRADGCERRSARPIAPEDPSPRSNLRNIPHYPAATCRYKGRVPTSHPHCWPTRSKPAQTRRALLGRPGQQIVRTRANPPCGGGAASAMPGSTYETSDS